jgi:hypothetical protein
MADHCGVFGYLKMSRTKNYQKVQKGNLSAPKVETSGGSTGIESMLEWKDSQITPTGASE